MIAASARRESSNCNSSIATPSRASLVGIRERQQANQRDIDRYNQMRRRRRWERLTSFRKDLCRRISNGLIIPHWFSDRNRCHHHLLFVYQPHW